jgi:ribose 1,5-bisphosphokinase
MSIVPFVLIVGNSGSGKDTLIGEAARLWPNDLPPLAVPKRFITRPPHPSEPFHSISKTRFTDMQANGEFCLNWISYDLAYGIPVNVLADQLAGRPVVVNVSRNVIETARENLPAVQVVYVHVPLAVTIERINRRGREEANSAAFKARIRRAAENPMRETADIVIDNSGPLEQAAICLCDHIQSRMRPRGE